MTKPLTKETLAKRKFARTTLAADKKFGKAVDGIKIQHEKLLAEVHRMYEVAIEPFHAELNAAFDIAGREYDEVVK